MNYNNSTEKKERYKAEVELSNKAFGKMLSFVLLFAIIVVSGFIIYYAFNQEPGSITFGILNEDKEAGNYPTVVEKDEPVEFYLSVENHLQQELHFTIKIYQGNEETELSSSGSNNANLLYSTESVTLLPEESWLSEKQSITFTETGNDQLLIAELWRLDANGGETYFNILWLRMNVTA